MRLNSRIFTCEILRRVADIASFVPVEFVDALFEGWRREVRGSKLRLRQ